MESGKTVSIIMPCYNAEITLPETLDSIARQSHTHWELIVVNDGSTDKSLAILNRFKTLFPDKVNIIDQENAGQVRSKNRGLENVKSPYIAFMDADDLWDKHKLKQQLNYMMHDPYLGLSYTNGKYIDEASSETGTIGINLKLQGDCLTEFLMGNAIVASSVMVRKAILDKVGYFDEALSACENWELWTRIASISKIGVIDLPLVYYRRHSNNMSHNIQKMKTNRLLVIQKNGIQYRTVLSDMNERTKLALYSAYSFFGENALWHLNLNDARVDLFKALSYQPFSIKCWLLLAKTLLGKQILSRVRERRASYG